MTSDSSVEIPTGEAIAADNLDQVVAVLARAISDGASPQAALAAVLEFVTTRHGEDGFAVIAVLVWSEALRNPTLAGHLRDAIANALMTLSGGRAQGDKWIESVREAVRPSGSGRRD